jgi:hypothetical protein
MKYTFVAVLAVVLGTTWVSAVEDTVELNQMTQICDHAFDGYVIHMRYKDKPKGTATSKLNPHIEEYDRLYQYKVRVTKVHFHRPNPFVHEHGIVGYSVGRRPNVVTPEQEAEDDNRRRKGMPPLHEKSTSKAVSSSLSASASPYSYGHDIQAGDIVNIAIWRVIHVDDRSDYEDEHVRGPMDISKHQAFSTYPTIADIVEDDAEDGDVKNTDIPEGASMFRFYTQGLHHRFETYDDTLEHFSKTAAQSASISVKALLGGDGDVEVGDADDEEEASVKRHKALKKKITKSKYTTELSFGALSAAMLPASATVEPHIPHGIERLHSDGSVDMAPQDKFTKLFAEKFNFGSLGPGGGGAKPPPSPPRKPPVKKNRNKKNPLRR